MKLKLLSTIKLKVNKFKDGLSKGEIGTIVEIFSNAYYVEFCKSNGETKKLIKLKESEVELLKTDFSGTKSLCIVLDQENDIPEEVYQKIEECILSGYFVKTIIINTSKNISNIKS